MVTALNGEAALQKNQSKKWVLEALSHHEGPVTPRSVAAWLGVNFNVNLSVRATSMELLRCSRARLIRRPRVQFPSGPPTTVRICTSANSFFPLFSFDKKHLLTIICALFVVLEISMMDFAMD